MAENVRTRDKFCVRCGAEGSQVHHRILGKRKDNRASNLILLCGACHVIVHEHSRESRGNGWIVTRHGPRDATVSVPVFYAQPGRNGWYTIDDQFGLTKEHGKPGTYNRKCRCLECTDAHRAYHAEASQRRALRAAVGDPAVPHGTVGGYKNWGCRCALCTAANTGASKDYYHRVRHLDRVPEPA